MEERVFEAKKEKLECVNEFIEENLDRFDCPIKAKMQIEIAVEEIFVNIANYAYGDKTGEVHIKIDYEPSEREVRIVFVDNGIAYNPLQKEDPDVKLAAEQRQIGGLGIFMTKKIMDEMDYKYEEQRNVLTLKKRLAKNNLT